MLKPFDLQGLFIFLCIKVALVTDPACGSGNFLTETYVCLRRLENEVLLELHKGQVMFANEETSPIQVSISQFYGIEINDFAVTVAKTALWIAESQMMKETEDVVLMPLDFLPLKTNANIVEGNSLRMDWNKIIPASSLSYAIGNPPFCGRRYRSPSQQEDVSLFFSYMDIDYVACWYIKAAEYIQGSNTEVCFVSTNSITQGEQVSALWRPMLQKYNMQINFAYRTFRWDSEAVSKAAVFCVIICFSSHKRSMHRIFHGNQWIIADNINGYLLNAGNTFIDIRSKPLCSGVPPMKNGNVPLDGDALKIEPEDMHLFLGFPYIKQLIGGRELLHNEKRYVLWLVGVSPAEIRANPNVYQRVLQCRENRLSMKDKGTQKLADTPTTFRDTNNPDSYIALPMVSSENRKYIPMAYLHGDVIPTNQVQTIPDATLYHFGVLTSNVHMAWMRTVCGRLKGDYRYSKDIVYNNFPWPNPTEEQKGKIEQTAQAILDARALYADSSLADLYDELTMPPELRTAHQKNDRAVMEAYGFWGRLNSESDCVAELMRIYQELIAKE